MGRFGWRAEHNGPRCSPDSCGNRIEASRFLSQQFFRMTMIVEQPLASYRSRGGGGGRGGWGVNARNILVERGTISGARLFTRILLDIIPYIGRN